MLLSKHIKGGISYIVICNIRPIQSLLTKFYCKLWVEEKAEVWAMDQVLKSLSSQGSNWTIKKIEICSGQAMVTSMIKNDTKSREVVCKLGL